MRDNINNFSLYTAQEAPKEEKQELKVTDYTAIIAISISAILLGLTLWQHYNTQKWKKIEFIAKEIKEFNADLEVQKALAMLDWNERRLEFFPWKEKESDKFTEYDNENLALALDIDFKNDPNPLEVNTAIRDIFSSFFDKLGIFNQYIKAGLFKPKNIESYLKYWLERISDEDKSYKNLNVEYTNGALKKKVNLQKQIWVFIYYFGYYDAMKLCLYFDKKNDIKSKIDKYISEITIICTKNKIKDKKYIKNFSLRTFSLDYKTPNIEGVFNTFLSIPSNATLSDKDKLIGITEELRKESLK